MSFEHRALQVAFTAPRSASFAEFLATVAPTALPSLRIGQDHALQAPHGTTIVALRGDFGAVMAGDRRATMGNVIAQRDIEKVFPADEHSLIGIAGTAGIAVELVRLFQVELEHYEKIEGVALSLDGKANRLASLLRGNLGLAMQGLAVVPLFAGYDVDRQRGRIFSYDVTGGRYEEHDFYAVGSGSFFARGSLKKLYRPDADVDLAMEYSACRHPSYDAILWSSIVYFGANISEGDAVLTVLERLLLSEWCVAARACTCACVCVCCDKRSAT